MIDSRFYTLFPLFVLGVLASSLSLLHAESIPDDTAAKSSASVFRLVLPPSAKPDSDDVLLRDFALRSLAYEDDTDQVVAALAKEKDTNLFLSVLDSLGSAGNPRAVPFVLEQCRSSQADIAAFSYSLLPRLNVTDPAPYQEGTAHKDPKVQVAALTAAANSAAGEHLRASFYQGVESTHASLRQAAVHGLMKLSMKKVGTDFGSTPEEVASTLFKKDFSLLQPIVIGLLRLGVEIPDDIAAQLRKLPEKEAAEMVSIHAYFPSRLDSDFLREVALGRNSRLAADAIALLASKSSRKNNATVACLTKVLASGDPVRLTAFFQNFDTDFEFEYLTRLNRAANQAAQGETAANNDMFGGIGSVPASISGEATPESSGTMQGVGNHIPKDQLPSPRTIFAFFSELEKLTGNKSLSPGLQNNARQVLIQESGTPVLLDIIHRLLADNKSGGAQLAIHISLLRHGDPRFIETILLAHFSGNTPLGERLADLAPFLERSNNERSRVLSRIGRKLTTHADPEKITLGLVLIGAHGIPTDAPTYLLPALKHSNAHVRRAAAHALARVSPEVYFLRLSQIATDTSPLVRATIPFAFYKTGYRWEHRINNTLRITQWVTPEQKLHLKKDAFLQLQKLETDDDATIRFHAGMALLQHGRLANPAALLAQSTPDNNPFFTAQLIQSLSAARAANQAIPASLTPFLSRSKTNPPQAPTLALFINGSSPQRRVLEAAIDALRFYNPNIRIVLYFPNDDSASEAKAALFKLFPVPLRHKNAPLLAFSSGAWIATDAPDFALLCQLASHAYDTDPLRLEHALGLPPVTTPVAEGSKGPSIVIIGAIIGLLLIVVGVFVWYYFFWRGRHQRIEYPAFY